jgi:hypothetical protein
VRDLGRVKACYSGGVRRHMLVTCAEEGRW